LDLSNVFEKVTHHCSISKPEEKKKKLVLEVVEKQLPNKESSTSGTKEEDKFRQEKIIVKDELVLGQPIMLS